MGAVERFAQGASRGLGTFPTPAHAQGPKPDAASKERTETLPPLKWLRYSSERFRTLMRLLATRSERSEAKRAAAIKAAEEARAAEEAEDAEEAKRATVAKAAEEAKRAEETKAAEEAKRAKKAKAAEQAKRAKEAKAAEEARRAADAKAAEGARRAAEEARRAADAKAAEGARRAADAKAAEGARAAEARRALDAEAKRLAGAKPAKRVAPCRNAGEKVAGGGWYVVQVGDSLWSISRAHYGYGRAYHRIHAANGRRIASPSRIYPCQRLYIPARLGDGPLQDLRQALAPFLRRRAGDGLLGFVDE
jgi:LysM domain